MVKLTPISSKLLGTYLNGCIHIQRTFEVNFNRLARARKDNNVIINYEFLGEDR